MTSIRERTILSVVDLPNKLTSRRNILAHFAKYGKVINATVKKELKSAMIQFATHFDAQAAKTQGKLYDGEHLNIFWSGATLLDPRSRNKQEYENETLWQDDDKECFGVENLQPKSERKQVARDLIKHYLKQPNIKRRFGTATVADEECKKLEFDGKFTKKNLVKEGTKSIISVKKSLLAHGNKPKIVKKEGEQVLSKQVKPSVLKQQSTKTGVSLMERTDVKHRLTMLDERDKLMRSETIQDSNIKTAAAIKGTCPDMCPERERLLRQCGHAVAIYEMLPGSNEMDENKAVKEYIRSSADQEVPLPHDLRPEPVLSMTMDYLITNIIPKVDNPNENKAIWYSFCWNRLRSIRKDIILQQLCDMETVKIVEQCARFHICCYDHMWGAEVSGFDDKINTKNLINCLQTLRHMYEDLAKHNVTCPNEAEFYSYLILLKLESGDVMWEYQQNSLEIQLSPHIQFAVEAYTAFKNNMYSRYFSLVKKASYLTACLMQRYFNQVRTQALRTMLRAYCLPGKNVGLSSSFIVSSLKFDSQKNALKFCEIEEVDVKVDMDNYQEDVYVTTSSFLIREKRLPIANAVVGQNNPLPVYTPHEVHSSFDNKFRKLKKADSFPIISNENSPEFSGEQPNSEEEMSEEVTVPEAKIQQSAFKFSLSPTKEQESFFSKSSYSSQTIQCSNRTIEENKTHFFDHKDLSITPTNLTSYKDNELHFDEMDQDFEQDTIYEENKNQTKHISHNPRFVPQVGLFKAIPFGPINPFLIQSVASCQETNIFTGLKNKENIFANLHKSPGISTQVDVVHSDNDKNSSSYSFEFPDNEIFPTNSFKTLNQFPMSNLKNERTDVIKCNSFSKDKIDRSLKVVDRMGFVLENQQKSQKDIEKQKENDIAHKKIQHALHREKIEKERLKLEEIERKIEAELMHKKKLEEQRIYESLKKDLSKRLKAINARKYARLWKKKVDKLNETRSDFPMLVPLSVREHLSQWGKVNNLPFNSLSQRAKDKKNFSKIVTQLMLCGISDTCKYIGFDLAEEIAHSAAKSMEKGGIKPIYWKLGISVPRESKQSSELSVFNNLMKRWCQQSFYTKANSELGSVECVVTSLEIPVNMNIHLTNDLLSSHDLQAMDALVFVVVNESETKKVCLQRLKSLVKVQAKKDAFAVAVMLVGGVRLEHVLKTELEELLKQDLITHWTMNIWSSPKSISESLTFLAKHVNVSSHICASPLELLIKQVSEELFDILSSSRHSSPGLMEALKNPMNVINLYNICLTKLENLLLSSKLEKYFNFPEDFKMHVPFNESGGPEVMCGRQYDDSYKSQIMKKIKLLKLPELSNWPPKSPNRLVKILKMQCQQINDLTIFPQIIRMLDLPDDGDLLDHLEQVSWLDIVETWAQCSLRRTFPSKGKGKQLFVMYNKTHVQEMLKKQWWLKLPMVVRFEKCL